LRKIQHYIKLDNFIAWLEKRLLLLVTSVLLKDLAAVPADFSFSTKGQLKKDSRFSYYVNK
jgi:hypothetical protein